MRSNRFRLLPTAVVAMAGFLVGCSSDTGSLPIPSTTTAAAVSPEKQDAGHRRLNQLVGEWDGAESTFVAGGTQDNPIRRQIVSRWSWIAKTGNNFLQEEAEDSAGSPPYYRYGLLGYGPTDDRYEWTTVDNMTPMTMSYKGAKASGSRADIEMTGEFTDPGILGLQPVGQTVPMRTKITLDSPDHVVMEIFFTPPEQQEILADRVDLTRRK